MIPHETDKRALMRVEAACRVTVSEQGVARSYTGVANNVSGRGVLLTVEREFPLGARLVLYIAPENPVTPPLDAIVEVVRVVPLADKSFHIGGVIREVRDRSGVIPDDHVAG